MLPRGFVAARTVVVVLFTLFLLTTPAFAAPRSEEHFGLGRMASFWSQLLNRVTALWAYDLLPPGGGGSGTGGGGGGSGTSLDPSGFRRPAG